MRSKQSFRSSICCLRGDRYHFDNIGAAMLCILITATLDGWVTMFFLATNATGVDRQPSANANVRASFTLR